MRQLQRQSGSKVKLVSREEAARENKLYNEVLLVGMPEDAGMTTNTQGNQGKQTTGQTSTNMSYDLDETNNTNNQYALDVISTEGTTIRSSTEKHGAAYRSKTQVKELVDPNLLE